MIHKTIVILACSVKRGGRCIAGKEVIQYGDDWEVGDWIRPVGDHFGAAVSLPYLQQWLGREPRLRELIKIPLEEPAPLPEQPENWLLASSPWEPLNLDWNWEAMSWLADEPPQLWHDATHRRRVPSGYASAMAAPASLYLIRPEGLTASVWTESWPEGTKHRRRAKVIYQGVPHEFDIDDPLLAERYYPQLPAAGQAAQTVPLQAPDQTFMTVSLTQEFNGHHYKIAAAFFEPPV